MSKEAVLKVKEAEAEARKIIEDATEKARIMVDHAQESMKNKCSEYEAELEEDFAKRVGQVRDDASALVEDNRRKAAFRTKWAEKKARMNMNDAVRIVLRRIISECQ